MATVADVLRHQVRDLDWVLAGAGRWMPDIEAALATAAVVVSHAGQNAVADIAAVRTPAVLVPCPRPHAEQEHLARALAGLGLAPVVPAAEVGSADWAGLVRAVRDTPPAWERWCTDGAPDRAADIIEEVGRG